MIYDDCATFTWISFSRMLCPERQFPKWPFSPNSKANSPWKVLQFKKGLESSSVARWWTRKIDEKSKEGDILNYTSCIICWGWWHLKKPPIVNLVEHTYQMIGWFITLKIRNYDNDACQNIFGGMGFLGKREIRGTGVQNSRVQGNGIRKIYISA